MDKSVHRKNIIYYIYARKINHKGILALTVNTSVIMMKLICKILLFLNHIFISNSVIIHPKGPTHVRYAVKCIEEITADAFEFTKNKFSYYDRFLLTYLRSKKLYNPAYEIQEEVLKYLHKQNAWPIEVLESRIEHFKSYSTNCITNIRFNRRDPSRVHQRPGCIRKHFVQLKTNVYISISDDLNSINSKVSMLKKAQNFNNDALYIFYYAKMPLLNEPHSIINYLNNNSIRNVIVMVPRNLSNFGLYTLNFQSEYGTKCYSEMKMEMPFECNEGLYI